VVSRREFTHQSLILDLAVAIGKLEFVVNSTMSVDEICKWLPVDHIRKVYNSDETFAHFTSLLEVGRNATRTEVLTWSSQTTVELIKKLNGWPLADTSDDERTAMWAQQAGYKAIMKGLRQDG
tara:strand:+ start:254 stop:622 length:369 start_codon:yes stop_codon:yes gene_type:complete